MCYSVFGHVIADILALYQSSYKVAGTPIKPRMRAESASGEECCKCIAGFSERKWQLAQRRSHIICKIEEARLFKGLRLLLVIAKPKIQGTYRHLGQTEVFVHRPFVLLLTDSPVHPEKTSSNS